MMKGFLQKLQQGWSRLHTNSNKNLSILSVILLVVAIPFTLSVLQQRQDVRQYASENQVMMTASPATVRAGEAITVGWETRQGGTVDTANTAAVTGTIIVKAVSTGVLRGDNATIVIRGENVTVTWEYKDMAPNAGDMLEIFTATGDHVGSLYLSSCTNIPGAAASAATGQCVINTTNYGPNTYSVKSFRYTDLKTPLNQTTFVVTATGTAGGNATGVTPTIPVIGTGVPQQVQDFSPNPAYVSPLSVLWVDGEGCGEGRTPTRFFLKWASNLRAGSSRNGTTDAITVQLSADPDFTNFLTNGSAFDDARYMRYVEAPKNFSGFVYDPTKTYYARLVYSSKAFSDPLTISPCAGERAPEPRPAAQGFQFIPKAYAQASLSGGETIQLFTAGANRQAAGRQIYLNCEEKTPNTPPPGARSSGACNYGVSSGVTPGSYVFLMYAADGTTLLGESNTITVTAGAASAPSPTEAAGSNGSMSLSTTQQRVERYQPFTVAWDYTGINASNQDYMETFTATGDHVGVYYVGSCNGTASTQQILPRGACMIDTSYYGPGNYTVKLFHNNAAVPNASVSFEITPPSADEFMADGGYGYRLQRQPTPTPFYGRPADRP